MSAEISTVPATSAARAAMTGKLITCIIPDDGKDVDLLSALRLEKGIVAASSLACRGLGAVGVRFRRRRLPRPLPVRTVSVVVPEERADEIFEFIYDYLGLASGRGLIYQNALRLFTPFSLPADVGDEK